MHGSWTVVEIAGKQADIYDPPGPGRPRLGILHLHGGGPETAADLSEFTRLFAELKLACVRPQGGRCWWGERLCREFDAGISPEAFLLSSVLPFFRERWGLAPRAIGVQGISMGGQGALRLGFRHPNLFPAVAAIASAVDYHELYGQGTPLDDMYDSKEQCRQDTVLLHIHPTHYPPYIFFCIDPEDERWYRGNDRLHEKLNALGIPHEADLTTRAGGHSWDYFNHMADRTVRFLCAGLEHESRRLL
ncbi:MAG TPA: alpha/beta hydrolase-fold protein [Gemmataceae bacterium]|nr:alpha/beta hydrolase-fold protein [Gemmataceae bacterium]